MRVTIILFFTFLQEEMGIVGQAMSGALVFGILCGSLVAQLVFQPLLIPGVENFFFASLAH